MSVENRRNVIDILSLNHNIPKDWEIIEKEYKAVDIDKLKIDGNTYTNYGAYAFIWEISYVKPPERSANGAISNLNSYAVIITGHLIIDYSIISIDDWRSIFRSQLEKREFVVECYDPIYNEKTKLKMYFATEQMPKFRFINRKIFTSTKQEWEDYILLYGVGEYTLEMIGTNNDLDLVSVVYHLNPPKDSDGYPIVPDEQIGEPDVYKGEEILIGKSAGFQTETFNGKYKFVGWNINPEGGEKGNYLDGYAYTINTNLVLYAIWESNEEKTLTFNYGLSQPMIDESTMQYVNNRKVVKGKSIGALPNFDQTPSVEYNGEEKHPYTNGKWWKTPTKSKKVDENGNDITDTLIVKSGELYWSDYDSTIYLLYDTVKYKATYYLDGALYSEVEIEYNSSLILPKLVKPDHTFSGWYTDSDYKNSAPLTMPPEPITLYARFVKNQ